MPQIHMKKTARKTAKELDVDALEAELDAHEVDPTRAVDAAPLRDLFDLVRTRELIDAQITAAVARARDNGISWGYIAEALGVSRQAARQKYSSLVEELGGVSVGPLHVGDEMLIKISPNSEGQSFVTIAGAIAGVGGFDVRPSAHPDTQSAALDKAVDALEKRLRAAQDRKASESGDHPS